MDNYFYKSKSVNTYQRGSGKNKIKVQISRCSSEKGKAEVTWWMTRLDKPLVTDNFIFEGDNATILNLIREKISNVEQS